MVDDPCAGRRRSAKCFMAPTIRMRRGRSTTIRTGCRSSPSRLNASFGAEIPLARPPRCQIRREGSANPQLGESQSCRQGCIQTADSAATGSPAPASRLFKRCRLKTKTGDPWGLRFLRRSLNRAASAGHPAEHPGWNSPQLRPLSTTRKTFPNSRKNSSCLSGVQAGTRNALRAALDAGDALIAAQDRVADGRWTRWLKENCFISARTAQLFMQLARHRDEIEAATARVADLSFARLAGS